MFFTILNSEEEGFKNKRYNDGHNNLVKEKTRDHKDLAFGLAVCFTNDIDVGRHEALRNVSQDWLSKCYTNNSNNGP